MADGRKAPGVRIRRLKEHQKLLNGILSDDRITGNRRLLGAWLAAWMDSCDYPEVQERLLRIIEAVYGNSQRIRWTEEDETPVKESQGNLERETLDHIKNMLAQAEGTSAAKV